MIRKALVACAAVLLLSGCADWEGLNSLPLPGTEGRGGDAYEVKVVLADTTGLEPNSRVRVDDVTVGTITDVDVDGWNAVLTLGINGDVVLPQNATAKIGQTSLLGSKHLELAAPVSEAPVGRLRDGAVIELPDTARYPTTEETLASLSVVLNGGGLAQLDTVTSELDAALSGRQDAVRGLLAGLNTFLGGLDAQKADILTALDGLNRFSGRIAEQNQVLASAVDQLAPALEVLNRQRTELTTALVELGELGDVATRVVNSSGADLTASLRDLRPALKAIADSGPALVGSLQEIPTVPFPLNTFQKTFRGDYSNLNAFIDLTLPTLDKIFLSGTPLQGLLTGLVGMLPGLPGVSGQSGNPLRLPLDAPALPAPLQEPQRLLDDVLGSLLGGGR